MKIVVALTAAAAAMACAQANAALNDKSAQEIMAKAGCVACHSIDKKGVGPSYKDVAKKRKSEKGALAMIEKKVREGGSGAYGAIPMPPNPKDKISDKELREMAEWILSK